MVVRHRCISIIRETGAVWVLAGSSPEARQWGAEHGLDYERIRFVYSLEALYQLHDERKMITLYLAGSWQDYWRPHLKELFALAREAGWKMSSE